WNSPVVDRGHPGSERATRAASSGRSDFMAACTLRYSPPLDWNSDAAVGRFGDRAPDLVRNLTTAGSRKQHHFSQSAKHDRGIVAVADGTDNWHVRLYNWSRRTSRLVSVASVCDLRGALCDLRTLSSLYERLADLMV